MKNKYPPPPRPTHIERHGKVIREIDRKCADLQELEQGTTDPESLAWIEYKLRALKVDRVAPTEQLAEWYGGLSESERKLHEDFIHRSLGRPSEEFANPGTGG